MANIRSKDFLSDMERKINSIRQFASDRVFGGVTLADLESARTASLNARTDIQHAENAMIALRNHRQESDRHYEELMRRAVAGLIADPDFGPDSDAYDAIGYTRYKERKRRTTKPRREPEDS
ncbi:MAG: hypothetical protein EKK65_01685 [Lysobacterales bacterium]|nr:MAG: hypothetical protein EKK65_01685 [Xanthomonadales bacterium]